jgi:hypothetical protein
MCVCVCVCVCVCMCVCCVVCCVCACARMYTVRCGARGVVDVVVVVMAPAVVVVELMAALGVQCLS